MQQNRRLAAILFTDIVGSTSMMQKDEQRAISINKRYVAVLKESVLSHDGEILNVFGDGVNVESRVQSLGIANSILFSSEICSKIKNQLEFKSVSVGRFHFKN